MLGGSPLFAPGQASEERANPLQDLEKKFPPTRKNAAAEDLERLALSLGIDDPGQQDADHPIEADRDAYRQANIGSWLREQIKTSNDSIEAPPPRLVRYLGARQAVLSRIVGLLQHESPEWSFDPLRTPDDYSELLFVQLVDRVLLSAALVEEKANRWREANDLLDASLSLSSSLASRPDLLSQLHSLNIEKLQIGTLRKLQEPPLGWAERVSGEKRWREFVDALERDPQIARLRSGTPEPDSAWADGWHRVWEGVRERSACECSRISAAELWRQVSEELIRVFGPTDTYSVYEYVLQAIRWGARLVVDRELTSKILAIRAERAASREREFPRRFFDLDSRVCRGETYEYERRRGGMSIRFTGKIEEPEGPALVLPLSFETRSAVPTRTPTPRRPLTRSAPARTLPVS